MNDYSPGLRGIVAGQTALAKVDGNEGRLHYRGYPIGDLVATGTYAGVAELLWSGEWDAGARLTCQPLPKSVLESIRLLPRETLPMDALRTAVSALGAVHGMTWPPTVAQARLLTTSAPTALAAFHRIRRGEQPIEPDDQLDLAGGFLHMLSGEIPDPTDARALDAYFIVGAEHGFNASTFAARVITSTHSDLASAVTGAIGALKGPLHGGAPSEVVDQLHQMGTVEEAERWINETLDRGERLMGFGHRVYRAYDPRARALREVAEGLSDVSGFLAMAVAVEEIALRILAERKPDYPIKTNVEFYAAAVLQGVGLEPDLFPATFGLVRHAGWTAHCLEQAEADVLIRPTVEYVGPPQRALPG